MSRTTGGNSVPVQLPEGRKASRNNHPQMAHREFLIHYPNGFKQHVSQAELASMSVVQVGKREYRCESPQKSIEELRGPDYLPGVFIWELCGKKRKELVQSTRGMIKQYGLSGAPGG